MKKYAYTWSRDQVLSFTEKYARATDLVVQLAGIRKSQLIKHMIHALQDDNQLVWRTLRRMIKSFEGMKYSSFKKLSLEERRNYLTYVRWEALEIVLDEEIMAEKGLTGEEEKGRVKKQG